MCDRREATRSGAHIEGSRDPAQSARPGGRRREDQPTVGYRFVARDATPAGDDASGSYTDPHRPTPIEPGRTHGRPGPRRRPRPRLPPR
jgi:hypothetical protein